MRMCGILNSKSDWRTQFAAAKMRSIVVATTFCHDSDTNTKFCHHTLICRLQICLYELLWMPKTGGIFGVAEFCDDRSEAVISNLCLQLQRCTMASQKFTLQQRSGGAVIE